MKDCKPCVAYLQTLRVTVEACREYGERSVLEPPAILRSALAVLRKFVAGRRPHPRGKRGRRQPGRPERRRLEAAMKRSTQSRKTR